MRHRKSGRKLNRNATHRLALFRNLTMSLIQHERIITTLPKAKAVRPFIERLITIAKQNTLHARRIVISRLGPMADAMVKPEKDDKGDADTRTVVQKLFSDIAPRFASRPGGYTRILKRHEVRLGDAGATAFIELLKDGETRSRAKAAYTAPAPAPKVEEQPSPEQQPAPETPPASTEAQAPAGTPPNDQQPPANP
jgi:large subunit ribosomal protein L17